MSVQVIQTISILVQNSRQPTSLYYLLSNNYVNELVSFDITPYSNLGSDELTPSYVSFLKCLAMRCSPETVLFMIVHKDKHTSFPLYDRAVTFLSSRYDSFVVLSAWTMVLNILKLCVDSSLRVEDRVVIAEVACRGYNVNGVGAMVVECLVKGVLGVRGYMDEYERKTRGVKRDRGIKEGEH